MSQAVGSGAKISVAIDYGLSKPVVTSATCHECDRWATGMWCSGSNTVSDPDGLFDKRVSRTLHVVVYVCEEHSEQVANALVEEFGHCSNSASGGYPELAQEAEDFLVRAMDEGSEGQ